MLRLDAAQLLLPAGGEIRVLWRLDSVGWSDDDVWLQVNADAHGRSFGASMVSNVTHDTEHVWQELHANLRSFVSRRVRNAADVDDLVQRVFLQVHRALPTLRDDERIHAWVYQTTRNTIADYYRAPVQRREVLSGTMLDVAEGERPERSADDGDEGTALRELAGCLKPLFERLSPEDQETLRSVEFEGMSQVEAARRLGLSTSGMKSRVQRARRRLKTSLENCCRLERDRRGGITSFESRRSGGCGPSCSSDCD